MFARFKQHFRNFRQTRSGTRFRRQFQARAARPHWLRTIFAFAAGLLLILLGIAMLVLPGPGLIAILLGAGLIAGESLFIARLLDRVDFRISAIYARWRDRLQK